MAKIHYLPLAPEHFSRVIALGNKVHGDNYLDTPSITKLYESSFSKDINASFVSLKNDTILGFRLTIAANHWQPDQWCSPGKWGLASEQICYFKCNTVASSHRQLGIGSALLSKSIDKAKQQGALAGLAHIWLASPGNSAFRYFAKSGGRLIAKHPGKWQSLSVDDGYCCPVCTGICECVAAEMLLEF